MSLHTLIESHAFSIVPTFLLLAMLLAVSTFLILRAAQGFRDAFSYGWRHFDIVNFCAGIFFFAVGAMLLYVFVMIIALLHDPLFLVNTKGCGV